MEKGRNCSLEYILRKNWTKKIKKLEAEVIYVVGGLYGNSYALEIINEMAQDENAKVVFNGDMHWFDVEKEDFLKVEELSKDSIKLLGNVEFELLNNTSSLGCGCNYPQDVSDGVVERSNIIHNMMKENIKGDDILNDIKERSKTLVLDFLCKKIAITHGDEKSMSGWECSNRASRHSKSPILKTLIVNANSSLSAILPISTSHILCKPMGVILFLSMQKAWSIS